MTLVEVLSPVLSVLSEGPNLLAFQTDILEAVKRCWGGLEFHVKSPVEKRSFASDKSQVEMSERVLNACVNQVTKSQVEMSERVLNACVNQVTSRNERASLECLRQSGHKSK
ncbi:hypothetical protein PoB_004237100 [Plakobranchus ocellatus]|uniref:Uncharacterized protein n=1 Tax=Plakobranchus ocellatus TaxID=259542 RepID=A0AAV4AXM6_9GAST|nr:hypothetical protein PoB_004237100 [Plakobranchus ocellatus]